MRDGQGYVPCSKLERHSVDSANLLNREGGAVRNPEDKVAFDTGNLADKVLVADDVLSNVKAKVFS